MLYCIYFISLAGNHSFVTQKKQCSDMLFAYAEITALFFVPQIMVTLVTVFLLCMLVDFDIC